MLTRRNALAHLPLEFIAVFFLPAFPLPAPTIPGDAPPSHSTNSIVPAQALGAGIDRLPLGATDKTFIEPTIKQVLSSGWQTISYRQNTELHIEAWHWNPQGTWSDPAGKGYFTGSPTPSEPIRHSYAYPLPHRGVTHDDGTDMVGYSRLTDGDLNSYWKSNPYLTQPYTGEDDSLYPQWVFVDLAAPRQLNAIRVAWAEPYARQYVIQYWTGEDPIKKPTLGAWIAFPNGVVNDGRGGNPVIQLSVAPMPVQYLRIWMTRSSNTCD